MPNMNKLQEFELNMLKDIVKICEDNNIQYYLSYGNLLGAVRHGGFIPWDDDIDLTMPINDYRRFLQIANKKLGEKYFIQNYKTEKNYCEMWTQIRAKGTTSMPKKLMDWDIHWGICIDVFPLVGVDEKKLSKQRKALALNRMLLSDKYAKVAGEIITSKMKLIYMIPRGIRRLICKINERRIMLPLDQHQNCAIIWYDIRTIYPSDLFSDLTTIKFEDQEFRTMKDYDKYLRMTYGDYMKLPPEDQRGGHSDELGDIIFDIKKDYSEYKKELKE